MVVAGFDQILYAAAMFCFDAFALWSDADLKTARIIVRRAFAPMMMALALAGCAGLGSNACAPGLERMIQAELFFGRNIAGRAMVSDDEWRQFLDEEVTPRFPAGFSVADIDGQYRNAGGGIVRERSKQLLIVGPGGEETKLNAIRDAYRRRFNQESVLLVESPVCAAF
jgi:hypothetical protein